MAIYVVTGKLGGGKSLISVSRIQEYIRQGRPVASNLNLNLVEMLGPYNRDAVVYRVPDKPSAADLDALGVIDTKADESKNGLLVLDECGTWFNSRNWNDPGRKELFEWFVHARKLGWDVIFIVQDVSILDKQAREAFAEHVVYCRRLDRLSVPIVGFLVKTLTGIRLSGPKVHVATVRYGDREDSLVVDRWFYRGSDLYRAYDTRQVFKADSVSLYQYLPPWLVKGRYLNMTRFRYAITRARRWFIRHPLVLLVLGAAFAAPAYAHWLGGSARANAPVKQNVEHSAIEKAAAKPKPFTIVGSMFQPNDPQYILERDGVQFTLADLIERGYHVQPVNACRVIIREGSAIFVATCALPKPEPAPQPKPLAAAVNAVAPK